MRFAPVPTALAALLAFASPAFAGESEGAPSGDACCCACAAPTCATPHGTETTAAKPAGYPVTGTVVRLLEKQSSLLVKHEEVPGVMKAMTMSFKVDAAALARFKAGDRIKARMLGKDDGWWLLDVAPMPVETASK